MLGLVGPLHADTMLRQSLHYCIQLEPGRAKSSHNVSDRLAAIIAVADPIKPTTPEAIAALLARVSSGQSAYGMAATGPDRLSDGARALIAAADRPPDDETAR